MVVTKVGHQLPNLQFQLSNFHFDLFDYQKLSQKCLKFSYRFHLFRFTMDVLLKVCNHGCYLGVCISEPKLCQKPVVSRVIGCPNLKRCFQFNFQTFHIPQSLTYRKVWPRILPKLYGYHTQVIRGLKGVYLCL